MSLIYRFFKHRLLEVRIVITGLNLGRYCLDALSCLQLLVAWGFDQVLNIGSCWQFCSLAPDKLYVFEQMSFIIVKEALD